MQPDIRTCIAYIAGRIISGKGQFVLYDYARALHIDMSSLPHSQCLKQCGNGRKISLSHSDRGGRYRYACGSGHFFHIAIHGTTFIGYVSKGSAHFIGNVRGEAIYLYDHRESAHFNYRISRHAVDDGNCSLLCIHCGVSDKGRTYDTQ